MCARENSYVKMKVSKERITELSTLPTDSTITKILIIKKEIYL